MVGDGHVHDTTALVGDDDEDEEQAARRRRHHEEVRRHDLSDVIRQERAPGLRRRAPMADHVFGDGGLTDVHAHLQQFAVDPRRTPERIGLRHGPNQVPHVFRHGRPTRAWTALPRPEPPEAAAMPRDDGRRFHDDERPSPLRPDTREPDPQPTVRHRQWHPPRPCPLQHVQLMSQRQELELESRARPRGVADGQEERPEHRHHCRQAYPAPGRNINRSNNYGVLGRHNT